MTRRTFLAHGAGFGTVILGRKALGYPIRRNVRFGIVGLGTRGRAHLASLAAVPGTEVGALCDIDRRRLSAAIRTLPEFGQPPEAFTDFRRMLDLHDIDMVVLAIPTDQRFHVLELAAGAGKPVIVDQPCVGNLKEASRVVRLATHDRVLIRQNAADSNWDAEEIISLLQSSCVGTPSGVSIRISGGAGAGALGPLSVLDEFDLASRLLNARTASRAIALATSADLDQSGFAANLTMQDGEANTVSIRIDARRANLRSGLERLTVVEATGARGTSSVTIESRKNSLAPSATSASWNRSLALVTQGGPAWAESTHYAGLSCLLAYGVQEACLRGAPISMLNAEKI